MVIAPEMLPGNQPSSRNESSDPLGMMNNPYDGLALGAPENFGDPLDSGTARLPGDVWPESEDEYDKLLQWCQQSFTAAESAKQEHVEKWQRYYRLYRSHIDKKVGEWKSTVFVPICFWVIETVTPRLVAQLPKFTCLPQTPEDVFTAENMEVLLDWSVSESGLYEELVKAMKSSLKYGTGILKTFHRQDVRYSRKTQPMFAPLRRPVPHQVMDETGNPLMGLDGQPITEMRDVEVGMLNLGMQSQVTPYIAYDGPAAECIDIFNFWPAPEAHDITTARYVVHRTYKPMSYIKRRVAEGVYHWPSNMTETEMTSTYNDPALERLSSIGRQSPNTDPTHRPCELLEFWLDDGRVITMVNRKALLRVQKNPFDHAEKPFIRIVDYLQEHEFWGVGEIEPIEGLQDVQNSLVNARIDNIRLVLNAMFYVNTDHVVDVKDFRSRPGGIIRGRGDWKPEEVFTRIDYGDVTGSAFTESELVERTTEKVSGVSGIQMGIEASNLNNTATGLALATEQGASRFGLKSKLIELMGLGQLGRQYASILQQFMTEERQVRLGAVDPSTGMPLFAVFTPDSIQGAIDIRIQAESTTQTESQRQEQKMNLLGLMAQFWPQGVEAAVDDVLDSMGIKDKDRFLQGGPITQSQMQQMDQQMQMEQGMGDPNAMPAPQEQGFSGQAGTYPGSNPIAGSPGDLSAGRTMDDLSGMFASAGAV